MKRVNVLTLHSAPVRFLEGGLKRGVLVLVNGSQADRCGSLTRKWEISFHSDAAHMAQGACVLSYSGTLVFRSLFSTSFF